MNATERRGIKLLSRLVALYPEVLFDVDMGEGYEIVIECRRRRTVTQWQWNQIKVLLKNHLREVMDEAGYKGVPILLKLAIP